ncbi:uncharacterized protein BDW43DRAFT_310318 [Aspergillus alliaceus]|uniref:uncharacterized protein n=1 Tax=Petromyces alliaceus TaxID=209559 RepID=UPI0012A55481|nr:uncharacterized protein BDW43DRAFT_310318 [Aspergillus alliaceus]KAB8234290.1 hypothetical protein BDW43DRAFT_310318 [Aspergillus alliaceus]
MSATDPRTPGSCAMRLRNLVGLSSTSKTALLRSIADDIRAAFISISKQLSRGTLRTKHTDPIHDLIASIKSTESPECQRMQQELERYRQRERRWRVERKWMRRKVKGLVRHSEEIHRRWKDQLWRAKGDFDDAARELTVLRWRYELSRSQGEKRSLLGEPSQTESNR